MLVSVSAVHVYDYAKVWVIAAAEVLVVVTAVPVLYVKFGLHRRSSQERGDMHKSLWQRQGGAFGGI
jgi:hypothetical protein